MRYSLFRRNQKASDFRDAPGSADNYDDLWRVLEGVRAYIFQVDVKAALIFAAATAIASFSFKGLVTSAADLAHPIYLIPLSLALSSLYQSTRAFAPQVKRGLSPKTPIYFGDVTKWKSSEYPKAMKEARSGPTGLEDHIIGQIQETSAIALAKYQHLSRSINLFVSAGFSLVIVTALLFLASLVLVR